MPLVTYDDLTKIKILPMDAMTLNYAGSNSIVFSYPEGDSSASIRAITEPDGDGGFDTAAHRLEVTWFVPYNNYQTMRDSLARIGGEKPITASVRLKAQASQAGGATLTINVTDPSKILSMSASWNMETVEVRPRIVVTLNSVFLPEVILDDFGSQLFLQGAGW